MEQTDKAAEVAIIGAGPAGLAAAEMLSLSGHRVTVFDAMPSVGRKFLLAGKSGLNLTHAEEAGRFRQRFDPQDARLLASVDAFDGASVRAWADGYGAETFTGSSGRVFPKVMKASPLLRAWLGALGRQGVTIRTRHRWLGFSGRTQHFLTPDGPESHTFDATLLCLGGASWPKLGSDAGWVPILQAAGVEIQAFEPANCGFDVAWSESFGERFAGAPVKSVTATTDSSTTQGEFVITPNGIEGSLVYAHAADLRRALNRGEPATLHIDLMPGRSLERLARDLSRQDGKASLSTRLRKGAGLDPVKAGLLRQHLPVEDRGNPAALAARIKTCPLPVLRPRPIAEAISSAGGITWQSLDDRFMLKTLPGLFAAGEMLDWEAPTGGYLISACLATGRAAAAGIHSWLAEQAAATPLPD